MNSKQTVVSIGHFSRQHMYNTISCVLSYAGIYDCTKLYRIYMYALRAIEQSNRRRHTHKHTWLEAIIAFRAAEKKEVREKNKYKCAYYIFRLSLLLLACCLDVRLSFWSPSFPNPSFLCSIFELNDIYFLLLLLFHI